MGDGMLAGVFKRRRCGRMRGIPAARLKQLADPGGICVSAKVASEARNKIAFGFESLSEQIAEDIMTMLSRFPELAVIARNSTFVYKSKPEDVRRIGKDLGVGYVNLEDR